MYAQSSFPSRKEPKTTKDEIRLTGTDGVVNQQQRDSTPLLPRSTNREIQPLYYLARPSKAALVSPFVASSLLPGLTDRLLAVRRICRFLLVVFGSRCGFLQHSKERKHHSILVERVTIIRSRTSRVKLMAIACRAQ